MNAIGYCRVSSEEQAKEGISLANQKVKIQAYALCKDLELTEIIEDAGESAKSLRRPGIQRVLSLIQGKKVQALVIYKLDRLTRSVRDLGDILELIQKTGVELMSVQESIDTSTAAGRMILNIMVTIAQWEREVIGERTSDALQYKKKNGEYTGGRPPYGWKLSGDGVRLEANEKEQEAIREARVLHKAGHSLRKIGRELERGGFPPRNGKQWHAKTIQDLLRAEVLL